MSPSVATELARLERRLAALERGARLRNASIESTAIPVYDDEGTLRQVVGQQDDGTYTVIDVNAPAPAVPSGPVVAPGLGSLVVSWDGLTVGGEDWSADFSHVEVHVSTVSGYVPVDATQVASLHSRKGGLVTIAGLDPVVHHVVLVAVNTSRVESVPTPEVPGTPDTAVSQAEIDAIHADVTAAEQAAANAQAAADAAMTTADGKNAVFYNNPATGDPAPTATATGDFWYRPDQGYKGYHWTGASWDPITFGSPAIAPDAVTTEHLAAGAVGSTELSDFAVTDDKIADFAVATRKLHTTTHFIY